LRLGALALQLSSRASGENSQDGRSALIVAHWLLIHHHQVAQNLASRIEDRHPQVALQAHPRHSLVLREERLNILRIEAHLTGDDALAGGACRIIGAIGGPKCYSMFTITPPFGRRVPDSCGLAIRPGTGVMR